MAAKAEAAPEAAATTSVTITRAQAMGKRPAEFQRGVMAERMDSGSGETPRNGGVRDNKRKGRKARLSKDRMLWPTGEEKQWARGRVI